LLVPAQHICFFSAAWQPYGGRLGPGMNKRKNEKKLPFINPTQMNMKTLPEMTAPTKATDGSHDFHASMDHLPQDHFRLLCLEPGDKDSEIHCTLATFELQSAPTYEALSYAWGDAVLSREITCNGSSLKVTSNLHDALQYLRQIDGKRTMWIDAVCIDQTNDQERTAQVGIMKNIYSNSDHVVIWLGKETDDDETAFAILEQYRKLFAEHGQVDIGPMETIVYKLALPAEDSKDWTALIKLFQKPWFQRIWVIQEAVVCLPTFSFLLIFRFQGVQIVQRKFLNPHL
jgi:hypothetical protein